MFLLLQHESEAFLKILRHILRIVYRLSYCGLSNFDNLLDDCQIGLGGMVQDVPGGFTYLTSAPFGEIFGDSSLRQWVLFGVVVEPEILSLQLGVNNVGDFPSEESVPFELVEVCVLHVTVKMIIKKSKITNRSLEFI